MFNTNKVLIWRLVLEENGLDIEYIKGNKNIVADILSRLTTKGNQETKQESTYKSKLCQK